MKITIIFIQVISSGTGIVAAFYWYKSSRIAIIPPPISGDPNLEHLGWTSGTMQAFSISSNLNRIAAIWTAITVLLAGFSSLISTVL